MSSKRAFTSRNVVLPGQEQPQPATIIVDITTGKITDVLQGTRTQAELPEIELVEVGERYILPGLVE